MVWVLSVRIVLHASCVAVGGAAAGRRQEYRDSLPRRSPPFWISEPTLLFRSQAQNIYIFVEGIVRLLCAHLVQSGYGNKTSVQNYDKRYGDAIHVQR